MKLGERFVSDEVEDTGFELLPAGVYVAQVKKTEIKTTKAGTGEYINLQWEILDADDERWIGRIVFQNINIVNPNETAVKIGKGQLKQIVQAMGLSEIEDTDELLGIPVKIRLKIRPGTDGYDDANEVSKVMSLKEGGESEAPW